MVFRGDVFSGLTGGLSGLGDAARSITSSLPQRFGNLAGNFQRRNLGDLGSVAQVFSQVSSVGNAFQGFEDLAGQFGLGQGSSGFAGSAANVFGGGADVFSGSGGGTASDSRARLSAKSAYTTPFSGPGAILQPTNGILFPYTPNISVAHQVEYSSYELVHTNYQPNAYAKSRTPAIQITGVFPSQTPEEAEYTVGVMHFLRVASKMNFGQSSNPGTPPPVLELSAYGKYNFNRVPVLIGGFNFIYEDGVDYVNVGGADSTLQIPVVMTIAIDLLPQYSPGIQSSFSIEEFASGSLYSAGFI
jgi:hypothetical protein